MYTILKRKLHHNLSERKKRAQVPRLPLVRYFPALTWRWLHVFPCFALVSCSSALGTYCVHMLLPVKFSRVWRRLSAFPLMVPVMCCPAHGAAHGAGYVISRSIHSAGYVFSRAWCRLCVFPLNS